MAAGQNQDTFIAVVPALLMFGVSVAAGQNTGYLYCCISVLPSDVSCSGGRTEYMILLLLYYPLSFSLSVAAQNTWYLYYCITHCRSVCQWRQNRIQDTFITVLPTVVQSVSGGRTEYRIPLLLAVLPADVRSFGGGRTEYSASCITCWRSVFQYWQDRIQDTFIAALPSDFFFFFLVAADQNTYLYCCITRCR